MTVGHLQRLNRFKRLKFAIGLCCVGFAGTAAAEVFIYELPSGARMITDHQLNNKQYKLIQTSKQVKGMGALINSRNMQPLLVDVNAYDKTIHRVAKTYIVDAALIKAVMHAESGFNPNAVSTRGASGLMQLMPETARRYGCDDIFDPQQNIRAGALYLKDLLKRFNNNHRLALAAYNAGENAVTRYKGIPPYNETQQYVRKVLAFKGRYTQMTATAPTKKTAPTTTLANIGSNS